MRKWIDELAYALVGDSLRNPPIDINAIARSVGVEAVREEDLLEDGRLIHRRGATSIIVRRNLGFGRRRFTIAHEIGHLLLLDPEVSATRRRQRWDHSDVERICDQIAAALLLPHDWVKGEFEDRPQRFATLRSVAHSAEVSMAAALVRLQEVASWHRGLMRFRYVEGRWRYASAAGVPIQLHGRLSISGMTRAVLNGIHKDTDDLETLLPLLIHGERHRVPAEISPGRTTALALVTLPPVGSVHTSRVLPTSRR